VKKNARLSIAARRASRFRERDARGAWAAGSRRLAERFWEKVDKNGPLPVRQSNLGVCWIWTGARSEKGYGRIDNLRAHRLSWLLTRGELTNSTLVLHRCDNPGCVRPEHLMLGSALDNTSDMFAKGRAKHRSNGASQARLTEDQIAYIRAARAAGRPLLGFARKYGVSNSTVYRIANTSGRRWW
jgi:hypothetical protein